MTVALPNFPDIESATRPTSWWAGLWKSTLNRRTSNFQQTKLGAKAKRGKYKKAFNETFVLDHKVIEIELQAHRHGAEDGATGYPPPGQLEHDRFHRDLIAYIDVLQRQQTATRNNMLHRLAAEMQAVVIDDPEIALEKLFNRAVSVDLKRLFDEKLRILSSYARNYIASARQYKLFRTKNNRLMDPVAVSVTSATWSAFIILLLVCLEGALNIVLLKDVQPQGIKGALFIAGLIALLNVGPSFVAGITLGRLKNLVVPRSDYRFRKSIVSYFAWMGIIAFLCAIGVFNAVVAHGRSLLAVMRSLDSVTSHAVSSFFSSGNYFLWITDLKSILMFLVGTASSAIAFWEGSTVLLDPYPGYSFVRRVRDTTRDAYEQERQELDDAISEIFDSARSDMSAIVDTNGSHLAFFQEQMRQYQALVEIQRAELLTADNVANMVARTYREANMAHRAGVPPPGYFMTPLSLSQHHMIQSVDVQGRFAKLMAAHQSAKAQVTKYLAKITDEERLRREELRNKLSEVEGKAFDDVNRSVPVMNEEQSKYYEF